jgi:hypothetical protein
VPWTLSDDDVIPSEAPKLEFGFRLRFEGLAGIVRIFDGVAHG